MSSDTEAKDNKHDENKMTVKYSRFSFYKIDQTFRKLDANIRLQAKEEALSVVDGYRDDEAMLLSYSLIATRQDCDFMFWLMAESLDLVEDFASKITRTSLGPYLSLKRSLLFQTPKSFKPFGKEFMFLMAVNKGGRFGSLPRKEKDTVIEELAKKSSGNSSIRFLKTTVSLDDSLCAFIFEADSIEDFLQLKDELASSDTFSCVLEDSSFYTAIARDPKLILDSLG
ncbi:chlorite dismutase family protein [Elusimicrobiota bacterium]